MSENSEAKKITAIMGSAPNESWTRVGQVISVVSVFSILGIGIGGVEMGEHSKYAPYVTLISGFFCMYYGGRLRKNLQIAERNHELDKRKTKRVKPEPTRGALAFLVWFKQQDLPITVVELSKATFPYDDERSKKDVSAALRWSRAEFWVSQGVIKKFGDTYEMRNEDN